MSCLGCGKDTLVRLFDFGKQPACNRFLKSTDEKEPLHALGLGQCTSCGLIQLSSLFPLEDVELKYDLAVYSEPEEHLDGLAQELSDLKGVDKRSNICGVSFKDATLVERMRRRGFVGSWVLDSRRDLGVSGKFAGPELIQAALNPKKADAVLDGHPRQDLVIARHLLEHAYDPRGFMEFLKKLVASGGCVVLEVPDCAQALAQQDYSTVWEEHTAYFTEATFRNFVEGCGFSIIGFRKYEYPLEGSLVCIARPGAPARPAGFDLDKELALGKAFSAGLPARKEMLSRWLASVDGKGLAFFGAGHLACVFLNVFGMKDKVRFVVDDNPVKKGLFMPGSGIPIVGSGALQDGVEFCLLSVNPRNEEKVVRNNRAFGGKFLSIFPSSRYALPLLKWEFSSSEVCHSSGDVLKVDGRDVGLLVDKAMSNAQKRCRLCAHHGAGDKVHEMLIVHTKDTYVRPHRHVGKTESFHVIEGEGDVIIFDDKGNVDEVVRMGDYRSGKKFYYRLSKPAYHALLIRSGVFVFHEVTNGPFVREETEFAPWAPDGKDGAAVSEFLGRLEASLKERLQ